MKSLISVLTLLAFSGPCFALEFKTTAIESQFKELESRNKSLYRIIRTIDNKMKKDLGKGVVITEVYRTYEEQEMIYGKDFSISPHMTWEAVDIRTRDLPDKYIRALLFALNNTFNEINIFSTTAIFHDIGLGPHLHIQFR